MLCLLFKKSIMLRQWEFVDRFADLQDVALGMQEQQPIRADDLARVASGETTTEPEPEHI